MSPWILPIAALALLGLMAWQMGRRRELRRSSDLAAAVIDPSQPPAGLSPGCARYVFHAGYDARCVAADLVDMACRGYLRIGREARVVGFRWRLQRQPDASADGLTAIQRMLGERLFARGGQVFELSENNARRMAHVCEGYQEMLAEQLPARVMAQRRDQITAFAEYLAGAALPDGDDGIDADAWQSRFAFALALDANIAWSNRLIRGVGMDAASGFASRIRWYHGSGSQVLSDLHDLDQALGQQFSEQIAALAKPPEGMFGLPGR